MKLFRTNQVHRIDAYTIEHEPIADIDLMERAAGQLFKWVTAHFSHEKQVLVFTGPGNNGGDSLALSRMLIGAGYKVKVFLLQISDHLSESCHTNMERLKKLNHADITFVREERELPDLGKDDLVIDGMFGSGLTRPLKGLPERAVKKINESGATVVAIDVPSGLFGEDNRENIPENILQADYTLTFQFPKLSFFFPENEPYTGEWVVLPIGLHPDIIAREPTSYHYLTPEDIIPLIRKRKKFSHKGTFGHALLISGSFGRMGAAVLASRACLRGGVGLLTTHIPRLGNDIIQTAVPEAMLSCDQSDIIFSEVPDLTPYSAIGAGPALDTRNNTQKAMLLLLQKASVPLVLDADALNILALHPEWLGKLPENTILTPHPKEFERMAGPAKNGYDRVHKAMKFAQEHTVIVVLKGAHTAVAAPDGNVYFNMTGNPGMATAGSGDVLTGIILSLLAQRYKPLEAALTGVYVHGLAGDLALKEHGEEALISSDIIEHLGGAFLKLKKQ
ncbi:MAG TPA: NAD(P)H-hydrate dehydratase [Bacteroidetes bacterium]|nr:NAD(P)H-hydrate dehydratase [Bacteroidota bacterium]